METGAHPMAERARNAGRALLAALAEPTVSALRVTIPHARQAERLAGGSSKCELLVNTLSSFALLFLN